ncbi:hypothetical protein KIH86_00010 [Paenibacillus sp. HN-1]|uniref:hypothetical protein n=1 Tax=Paenibacillus TaxID=44249 RepID=UPI001CA8E7C0|nr:MULTISPECIES: hypothetical protein [Paenibacillus]MBY9079002.1 hypothetical protein [Paenibacillus sp. CGMCC 1.18879]MBY9082631.1 hypothetical protein [Paenibacillus sinensis]
MMGKDRYDNIKVPDELASVIHHAQKRAAARKHSLRVMRFASVLVACVVLLFVVNIPSVANAMTKIPVVGKIVQVLQFGEGGEITDGASVGTEAAENTLKIHFSSGNEPAANVPFYTVEQKSAPNRLIFTFNGTRQFDYDTIEKDLLTLPLVKDVYRNIILDDSAMRFVVELKDGVEHSISEYKDPGYLELKLTPTKESAPPHEVFSIRTEEMLPGEEMGMLEEQYPEEDISFIKTASGQFIAVIGEYDTAEEAKNKLNEISKHESYNGEFFVDSWMNNESPK